MRSITRNPSPGRFADRLREDGMRFLVLGAGSLGGYLGAMLLKGGAEVAFLVRPARATQLAERGLVVRLADGELRRPVRTLLAGGIDGRYDVVLLACKTYDLDSAADAVAPALGEASAVLPVLNGLGHIDFLAGRLGRGRVLGGVSNIAAARSPEGEVIPLLGPEGTLVFGELDGTQTARCREIRQAFEASGVPCRISADIIAEMWVKLFGFAAIAAIATLTRGKAGEIAAASAAPGFVAAVIDESAHAVAAEGYPPPPALQDLMRGLFAREGSPYAPSILRDVEQGRPTEAEDTIGVLVGCAERGGIEVPLLRAALCGLQVHEVRRRAAQP
jgi:2-dehydropantoate 2-reductase